MDRTLPRHLRRQSGYPDCPDIVINTRFDPVTGTQPGLENQASQHGGLGGPQNHPFVLYPTVLPAPAEPLIGAESVTGSCAAGASSCRVSLLVTAIAQ